MRKQVGTGTLGWLSLLAGGLWLAYKYEYLGLLLGVWSDSSSVAFDRAAEQRLLIFILSPGFVLVLAGIAMLMMKLFSKFKGPNKTIAT